MLLAESPLQELILQRGKGRVALRVSGTMTLATMQRTVSLLHNEQL
jgi:hypothetical protein